jgi:hypothetical protein
MEKYCRSGLATDNNMAHTNCMLGTQGYKHTVGMCNIYCFSTTTMVAQTRLSVTLYAHCLSCYVLVSVEVLHTLEAAMCSTPSDTGERSSLGV